MFPRSDGVDGRSPSHIYINKIVFVCLCVCLSVCTQTPPREMHQYGHAIYQSKHNLSGKDYFAKRNLSEQLSGRYCPETGHR